MATPMTPDQALTAFRKEGLTVVEIPGWRTNDRAPITGSPAGPKHGLVNHHTGGDTSDPYKYAATVLFKGYTGLPGPLCHQGLDPDTGTLYMVGTGRTNHAGGGDPKVLVAVKADAVPYDRELKPTKGNSDGVDGNAPFYGLEVMYSGGRDVPRVGYVAMVRWNTAICRFHGWSGASAIAHREWSDDKPDPGRVNLPQLRRDVDAALALPAGAWGSTPPPPIPDPIPDPIPAKTEEDSMFLFRAKSGAICVSTPTGVRGLDLDHVANLESLGFRYGPANLNSSDFTNMDEGPFASFVESLGGIVQNFTAPPEPPAAAARSIDSVVEELVPDCAEPSKHNV